MGLDNGVVGCQGFKLVEGSLEGQVGDGGDSLGDLYIKAFTSVQTL